MSRLVPSPPITLARYVSSCVANNSHDGIDTTVITDKSADGNRYNSPNDLIIHSNGSIYFTDPPYGLPRDQKKEQAGNYVFRYDPKTKSATAVVTDFDMPNGIALSPDEKKLYVADSGRPHHIRVFDINPDGTVVNAKIFAVIDRGGPDGIRVDSEGRVWSSAGDGVHVFAPSGEPFNYPHVWPS